MTLMGSVRFINNTCSKLQEANQYPIFDYNDLSVLTLEEAIEKIIQIVPDVLEYVSKAKQNCNRNSTFLTWDESAAIYLYTMPVPFFSRLNIAFRAENRNALKPWFAFLKLFTTALEKLPSTNATIWRGVNYDDTLSFIDNDVHVWWNINSCSMNPNIVEPFLGESGTLFVIHAINGKDISSLSAIPDEQEVILMPGTRVRCRHESLNFIDRLFVLHLEEVTPQR
jgi:NAD:arginine ADP-ribosyltransferase